jgi:hypothetical protein
MIRFTIQKLMVAIAVLALCLGAIIGLTRMGPSARICGGPGQCANNLHSIALALAEYHENYGAFPKATMTNPDVAPEKRLSWYAMIATYLDCAIKDSIHADQPWDSDANDAIASTRLDFLDCPYARAPRGRYAPTHYVGIAGVGTDAPFLPKGHLRAGVFGYDRWTALADIADGASQTIMVAESARSRDSWLAGGPATVRGLDTADSRYIGAGGQFGGLHPSGMYTAFADGSVRFIPDTIDPRVLEALSTVAGGDALSLDAQR